MLKQKPNDEQSFFILRYSIVLCMFEGQFIKQKEKKHLDYNTHTVTVPNKR